MASSDVDVNSESAKKRHNIFIRKLHWTISFSITKWPEIGVVIQDDSLSSHYYAKNRIVIFYWRRVGTYWITAWSFVNTSFETDYTALLQGIQFVRSISRGCGGFCERLYVYIVNFIRHQLSV